MALAPAVRASGDDPLPGAASGLLTDLMNQAPGLRARSLAVGEFPGPDGKPTALSAELDEALENALVSPARARDLKLVDRHNLETLAHEWDLDAKGYVEDESAKQAGKLLGVDVFLTGKYSFPEKKKLMLRATLLDSQTGQILGAASIEFKIDKSLRKVDAAPYPVAKPVEAPPPAKGTEPLQVKLWTEKQDYTVGEKFKVMVQANQDCYLTLIDVGTSGSATIIYPNAYAPGNAVKAGVTYTIPDPSAGFEFEVTGPVGHELLRAIASKEPSVDLADAMGQVSAQTPFAEVKKDLPVLTRDIHVKAKQAKPGEWSEASLSLGILTH
jgi:hypothetical protein